MASKDNHKLHIGFDRQDSKIPIELPVKTLKRHFAALGSSGSGKTVLVKCVIEECIRAEIPLIIIDIQGDLASLALMGDKNLAESKGTPGKYYDEIQNKAQVSIFTPASSKGIALSMNPLKAPPEDLDEEDHIQAIDSVAVTIASVLKYNVDKGKGLDVKNYLYLLLESVWGEGEEVESFSKLANIIKMDEDYLDSATQSMLDDKTKDELIKNVKALTIGADSLIFNMGVPIDVDRMMNWNDPGKVPINVLYLNTLRDAEDRVNFIANTATQIYNWMLKNPSDEVQLVFILDELAGLVPPIRNPPSKKSVQLLLKQARKYGVSLLLATQNISDVDYKSLGQVGTWALGRLMAKQDIEKVRDIIQSISPTETDKILGVLSKQKAGQFVLLAPDVYKEVRMISARWLVTDHTTLDDGRVKQIIDQTGIRAKFPDAVVKRKGRRRNKESAVDEADGDDSIDEVETDEDQRKDELIDDDPVSLPLLSESNAVLELMDSKPVALSVEEIADLSNEDPKKVSMNMEKLVKDKKLETDEFNGIKVFWSKKHKMDPKNNIVGQLFRMHIDKPRGIAEKIMKKNVPKTLGIRALEDIIDDETRMLNLPLWRIGVLTTKRGKKVSRKKSYFYINALTGEVILFDQKKKRIDFRKSGINPKKVSSLNEDINLEEEIVDGIKDDDLKPKLNREDGIDQVKKLLGLRIDKNIAPSLVWMPVWQFTLADKDTNHERQAWIDGVYGSYFKESPLK